MDPITDESAPGNVDEIPRQKEILVPFLRLLEDGREYSIHTVTDDLATQFRLSHSAQKERYVHSGELKFFNSIRFARLALAKGELVTSSRRGFVEITDKGRDWIRDNPEATSIDRKILTDPSTRKSAAESRSIKATEVKRDKAPESEDPISDMDKAYSQIHNKLKEDLYMSIINCDHYYFEKIVIDLLINLGYGGSRREAGRAFSRSKDEGVDGVINEDRLGLDKIYVQAKRWAEGTVGRPEIQKFVGALAGKNVKKGIFITTSRFSQDALNYVDHDIGGFKVVLVNKEQLIDYMIESNTGVIEDDKYSLPIKKIDHDYFEEES